MRYFRFANALSKLQTRYRNAQSSNSATHPRTLGLLGRSCAYLFFNAIVRFIRRKIKCCYPSASDSVQDDDTLNSLRFHLACHDDMNRTKPYEINILASSVYSAEILAHEYNSSLFIRSKCLISKMSYRYKLRY